MIGGYVLFPGGGKPEDFEKAYYRRSIERVNIGALPLRPGNEENGKALENFIRGLLEKKTEEHLIGMPSQAPKGTELELEGAISPARILSSGGKTSDSDARWMWQHGAFFLETAEYDRRRLGTGPEGIRIVSIAWMPPVTLLVKPGSVWSNADAAEIEKSCPGFPRKSGVFHVWFGDLANADNWKRRFGEKTKAETAKPSITQGLGDNP